MVPRWWRALSRRRRSRGCSARHLLAVHCRTIRPQIYNMELQSKIKAHKVRRRARGARMARGGGARVPLRAARPTSAAQTPRAFPQTADDAIPVYWNWVSPTTIGIVTAVRARE